MMKEELPSFPYPSFTRLALELAPQVGVEVEVVDPSGYLIFLKKDGKKYPVLADTNPLNSHTASRLARDKAYTNLLLGREGLPLPRGDYFFFPDRFSRVDYSQGRGIEKALCFAENLGYPLIVKPNVSSMGTWVTLVSHPQELEETLWAMEKARPEELVFLLQEFVEGREMRIFFLDGEALLAIEKKAFSVVGTGEKTVRALVESRWEELDLPREKLEGKLMEKILVAENLGWDSVLSEGQEIILDPVAFNLHRGATAWEVSVEGEILEMGRRAMEILNLRYGALDLKVDEEGKVLALIEINSNGGFFRFARGGPREERRAREVFLKILEGIFG